MNLLSKSAILDASDLKHEDVPVPQWGGSVRVRSMSGEDRDEFRSVLAGRGVVPVAEFSAALLAVTCVDAAGARLFSLEDMPALRAKSPEALDAAAAVAMRLNGLGATAVEDAVKNSGSDQSGDSGSASPKS